MPEIVTTSLALFFAWLFGVAGYHKLSSSGYYAELLTDYVRASVLTRRATAALLGAGEIVITLLLLVPASRPPALAAAALLLAVYALGMLNAYRRLGGDARCACSGPKADIRIGPSLIVRNLLLATLALATAYPVREAAESTTSWTLIVPISVFIILTYLCSEQLMSNAQRFGHRRR